MGTDIVVALLMALGLATVVVPVLPGTLLIGAGLLVWASEDGGRSAWVVAAVGLVLLAAGAVVKYVVPGRRLKDAGVPFTTQLAGLVLGVVGFFVIPVVGLFLGFVLGVWLAELRRLGRAQAWPSTKQALRAAGLSILIELGFGLLAVATWVVGLVAVG
ncbi:DUF456 domain-containing protein [Nocardioides sp. Kera G14]|uniref:DUF456 domain-containing protein n=1 Tax=Nocardioides sp. Kera G14 TaxID=2884264 RepID=UPI001D1003AF|nr:DUF456 domain-containing protein [Nocardioides sp. Kera G14]UDY25388.1 DUF456 domain-containing protein [Nocardioides sp. Kera G14]